MRKVIKHGVRMKRMICETCGQIELISMEGQMTEETWHEKR